MRLIPTLLLMPALALAGEVPVTLADAMTWADAANEGPAQAQAKVERAVALRRQALALLLPSVSANGSYSSSASADAAWATRPNNTLSGSISANWYLFNAQSWPGLRGAERQLDAARLDAGEARRSLAFQVASGYLDVLAAEQTVAAAERRRVTAAQAFKDAQARTDAGLAARGDVARAEVEDASAELALTSARRVLATARVGLEDLVGRPLAGAFAQPIDIDALSTGAATVPVQAADGGSPAATVAALDVADPAKRLLLVQTALNRADIAARTADADAAALAVRQQRGQYLPTVTANGSYSDSDSDVRGSPEPGPQWRASITASVTMFDAGAREAEIDAAIASRRQAQLVLQAARRRVIHDVALACENLASARASVRQAEVQLRAAKINAEDVTARGKQGLATALEVADANVSAFEADSGLVRQRLALAEAWLSLRQTIGLWPLADAPLATVAKP
jgi:multidrug efflux system outer membrane protein